MELEIDIKMTANALYDYLLFHMYSSFQGILGAVAGAFLLLLFFMGYGPIYLIAGLVVEAYLPYTLFLRSRKQFLASSAFREPLHYVFTDAGMSVEQGEIKEEIEWDLMVKAVSTPSSIIIYTSRVNASIFPKKDLGDKKAMLIEAISTHMDPKKVKIRG